MVHRREWNDTTLVFGNQGDLFGNAMTWWDHETGSIWSQPLGEAILGPRKGAKLEMLPSTLTTWAAWREAHPETQALDVPAWRTSHSLHRMAVVVARGDHAVAYPVPALRDAGVVNDRVGELEIAVVVDPGDANRWAAFSRRLDDSVAEFILTADGLVDVTTGTVFDPFLGTGRSGPLASQALDPLPAFTAFPTDFDTFFPNGRAWEGRE